MDFDLIFPHLYVGPCPIDAVDIDRLNQAGIRAILNVQTEEDFTSWHIDWDQLQIHYQTLEIEVRHVPVRDFDPESLQANLPRCVQALDELLKKGHTVYTHCNAGMNRSPSVAIAYLHWIEGWHLDDAVQHVTKRRACDPYVDAIRLASQDRAGQGNG